MIGTCTVCMYVVMCINNYSLIDVSCVYRLGPAIRYWCMRFESKHSYFKSLAHRVKCFKNIAKTLANRHQAMMCYYLSGDSTKFAKDAEYGRVRYVVVKLFCKAMLAHVCSYGIDKTQYCIQYAYRQQLYTCNIRVLWFQSSFGY